MGRRFVSLAAAFYGALLLLAAVLDILLGLPVSATGGGALYCLLVGTATACITVASSLLAYRLLPVLREISEELAPRLVDRAGRTNLVLVSIFSGVGEEVFFRGMLQPLLGIVTTSVLFGLLHVGPDRRYIPWTVWAIGAGFLFGALYIWTGGLLTPVAAHVLHNAAILLLWRRSRAMERTVGGPRENAVVRGEG